MLIMLISFAFWKFSAVDPTPTGPRPTTIQVAFLRPVTGTDLMPPGLMSGLGSLRIINHTDADAVVKLIDASTRTPLRFVYVRGAEEAVLQAIDEGIYKVVYSQGEEWDPDAERFQRHSSFFEFEDLLDFSERPTIGGVGYSTYELTLHRVVNGNARTRSIPPDDF